MSHKLEMTFDPMTIEHLGVRMYSTLPPVLGELIANSYDADASYVKISLNDIGEKEITVEDDGMGMSFDEINTKFLRIGRNRREEDGDKTTPKGRKAIGKKGLGKLSFFGITHEIEVETWKDGKRTSFVMDWDSIRTGHKESGNKLGNYAPHIKDRNVDCDEGHGTRITLRKIQRQSDFYPNDIAESLSKIFICDSEFSIFIVHNTNPPIEVTNDLKYQNLDKEICWNFPAEVTVASGYHNADKISGFLFTTSKPISPKSNMRGITLFSRHKMVNAPEYFSESSSSHFYSYLTGWLEIDFIDDLSEDVIGTNRQTLNWNHPEMKDLRDYLQKLVLAVAGDWRKKRAEIRTKKLSEDSGVDVAKWRQAVPKPVADSLGQILDNLVRNSELEGENRGQVVQSLHKLAPENTYFHWKRLHPTVHKIAERDYAGQNYFDATEKASRLYIQKVKDRSGVDLPSDDNVMDSAFNSGNGRLLVTGCSNSTERSIQNGQQHASKGVVAGCRNPLAHNPEYEEKLVKTGLFDDDDCLDWLSLISHLFRRLDRATLRGK